MKIKANFCFCDGFQLSFEFGRVLRWTVHFVFEHFEQILLLDKC